MPKPKLFLVMSPVGTGKTRRVWERIMRGAGADIKEWRKRIRHTLILGPNGRIEDVWKRELSELAGLRLTKENKESLSQEFKDYMLWINFDTYRGAVWNRIKGFPSAKYVVLDEWHRVTNKIFSKCKKVLRGESYFFNKLKNGSSERQIFFVSATPINPVLEENEDRLVQEDSYNDIDFQAKVSEGKSKALQIMAAFGVITPTDWREISNSIEEKTDTKVAQANKPFNFIKLVKSKLNVELLSPSQSNSKWPLPKGLKNCDKSWFEANLKHQENIAHQIFYSLEKNIPRSEEYAMCAGLVRTRGIKYKSGKYKLLPSHLGKKQLSFGREYSKTYIPGGRGDAVKWLKENHPRLNILKKLLAKLGVPKAKAVIFCVHHGVSVGLHQVLKLDYDEKVRCLTGNLTKDNKILKDFNGHKNPRILIGTDAFSESLDMHGDCNILIHYELPWSPLRLYQRVGRVTRLKADGKFNKNVQIGHIVIPGSVEEERVNRLYRRIRCLAGLDLWPKHGKKMFSIRELFKGLLGDGPSLHYWETLGF